MSEENNNEEFDKFLNDKEKGGGFENVNDETPKSETSKKETAEEVDAIEEEISKKGLGSVNIANYGRQKADDSDSVLGYVPMAMETDRKSVV